MMIFFTAIPLLTPFPPGSIARTKQFYSKFTPLPKAEKCLKAPFYRKLRQNRNFPSNGESSNGGIKVGAGEVFH